MKDETEGTRLCVWGNNAQGQLGFQPPPGSLRAFGLTLLGLNIRVSDISCGFAHVLLRSTTGELYATGDNKFGQIGIGIQTRQVYVPVNIPIGDGRQNVTLISAQGNHSLAYTEQGKLFVWGDNSRGQLGTGGREMADRPLDITFGLHRHPGEKVLRLSCGAQHSLILLSSGRSLAWGSNEHFQLGVLAKNGDDVLSPSPCLVESAIDVAAGYTHSLWLGKTGNVLACGLNANGELAKGFPIALKVPTNIELPAVATRVYAAKNSAVFTAEGAAIIWGSFYGRILAPTTALPKDATAVALGGELFAAVTKEGEYYAFGFDETGNMCKSVGRGAQRFDLLDQFECRAPALGPDFMFTIVARRLDGENLLAESTAQLSIQQSRVGNVPSLGSADDFLRVSRVLVMLYENLRTTLIQIIDDHVDVDGALDPNLVKLIKRQQDVIDNYLSIFDLRRTFPEEPTLENIEKFDFPNSLSLARAIGDCETPLNALSLTRPNAILREQKEVIEERVAALNAILRKYAKAPNSV